MPANRIHLVRHGEVFNPNQVIYGRLDGFHLSDLGKLMAERAAELLVGSHAQVARVVASPLLRTQQSAAPIASLAALNVETDARLIEPYNIFEGRKLSAKTASVRPHWWWHFRNPAKPSWGEPFVDIEKRMMSAVKELAASTPSGDLVLVSHQLPITTLSRRARGLSLFHNPTRRRCSLSSITSFELVEGKLVEIAYQEPALGLKSTDAGAV
jgi:broad specificity phosphatase PhoE